MLLIMESGFNNVESKTQTKHNVEAEILQTSKCARTRSVQIGGSFEILT